MDPRAEKLRKKYMDPPPEGIIRGHSPYEQGCLLDMEILKSSMIHLSWFFLRNFLYLYMPTFYWHTHFGCFSKICKKNCDQDLTAPATNFLFS